MNPLPQDAPYSYRQSTRPKGTSGAKPGRSVIQPTKKGRSWKTGRHAEQTGTAEDATQHKFWEKERPGQPSAEQNGVNRRWRKLSIYSKQLSPKEARIRWMKGRHELVKLRKKHPEIDWERPDRDARQGAIARQYWARKRAGKA